MLETIKAWGAEKYKDWQDMDAIFRWIMIGIVVVFAPLIAWSHYRKPPEKSIVASLTGASTGTGTRATPAQGTPSDSTSTGAAAPNGWGGQRILPDSPRNQGLETVMARLDAMDARDQKMAAEVAGLQGRADRPVQFNGQPEARLPQASAGAANATSGTSGANPLGKDLPEAVSFDQPGNKASAKAPVGGIATSDVDAPPLAAPIPARPMMISDPVNTSDQDGADDGHSDMVLPIYSGLEAVMLSGVNARPSGANNGSSGGAAGGVTAALDVGAPFVSRVKGMAIMPNSWKASELENCFIGGSATAVLSAERAYAIADHISCIFKNGDVYEAGMKAYALDVDGTLGLAGKVVNKQGAMLMQAALTGVAAGLGSALAPTAVPSYNTNVGNGSQQGFTVPSPSYLAGTAVGQGVNHAATELSQFYLNFAKETFPVVEVTAGTRVTWILEQDITLKKRHHSKEASS